jgi:hypothetical protein
VRFRISAIRELENYRLLFPLAVMVPPVFLALFIAWNHVDIPFWDQWDQIPLLEKSYNGSLTWADLWAQCNEHRLFSFYLAWLPVARLTSWSHHWELMMNFLVHLGAFLLFGSWFAGEVASVDRQNSHRWMWIALSVLFFSGIQWENWFIGFQLQYFLNVATVLCTVLLLSRSAQSVLPLLAAVPVAAISSFTTANGLLLWPIGLLLILFARRGRQKLLPMILWIFAGLLCVAGFFTGYQLPAGHPSPLAIIDHPLAGLLYLLDFLGAPLIKDWRLAAFPGAAGLGLYLFLAKRMYPFFQSHFKRLAPLFGIGLYAIGSAAMIGAGRLGFGPAQAVTSRYTTFSLLLWIALVCLLYLFPRLKRSTLAANEPSFEPSLKKFPMSKACNWAAGCVLALACLSSAAGFISAWYWLPWRLGAPHQAILDGRTDRKLMERIYSRPELLPEKLEFLKKHRLSLFRDAL